MRVDQLSDSEKRTLADRFWRGAHREGEPLGWDDMDPLEQRDAAAAFNVKPKADKTQATDALLAQTASALLACMQAVERLAKEHVAPRSLARTMARAVKEYAPSRDQLDDAIARVERLQISNIRATDALTGLLETLAARVDELERRLR